MITLGESFPDFSLHNQEKALVSNKDLKGQAYILVFYPGDMTPGCTIQLCAIRDEWKAFQEAGIAVFGINQANAKSHKHFQDLFHLPFPLLIDEGHVLSQKVGAVRSLLGIRLIKRVVIGVDGEGKVRMVKPGMPKVSELLKTMKPFATHGKHSS